MVYFQKISSCRNLRWSKQIKRQNKKLIDLIYKKVNRKRIKYDFQKFKTVRFFGKAIYSIIVTLNDALEEQIILKDVIDILNKSTEPKKKTQKKKTQLDFLNQDKKFLMVLKAKRFQ